MPTTSSTGVLANISREMISVIRYTNEHNAVMAALVEKHMLSKGEDTAVFPKVGQVNVRILNEGEDMTDEQDLGLTTLSVNTNQVGGYIILTKRAQRRVASSAGTLTRIVARQFGDAEARLENEDLVGLFSALGASLGDLGAAGRAFTAANAMAVIGVAKSNKFGSMLRVVVHPNCMLRLARDLSTIGSGTIRPLPKGFSEDVLEAIWTGIRLNATPFFETGDISRDGSDDAINAILDKSALGVLKEAAPRTTTSYLPRRDADEIVFRREYIAFEIDDTKGAFFTMDALDPVTA